MSHVPVTGSAPGLEFPGHTARSSLLYNQPTPAEPEPADRVPGCQVVECVTNPAYSLVAL